MPSQPRRALQSEVAIVVLLSSWACSQTSVPAAQNTTAPSSTMAPTSTEHPSQPTDETPPSAEGCEEPATEIRLAAPVSSEVVGHDQPPPDRKYFCVHVPDGVRSITFELTQTTSDLNLYVGHPDLEAVQQGGLSFWASNERGTVDKVVGVEATQTDFVSSGPYYIEVSAQDFRASSPFTLNVDTR